MSEKMSFVASLFPPPGLNRVSEMRGACVSLMKARVGRSVCHPASWKGANPAPIARGAIKKTILHSNLKMEGTSKSFLVGTRSKRDTQMLSMGNRFNKRLLLLSVLTGFTDPLTKQIYTVICCDVKHQSPAGIPSQEELPHEKRKSATESISMALSRGSIPGSFRQDHLMAFDVLA